MTNSTRVWIALTLIVATSNIAHAQPREVAVGAVRTAPSANLTVPSRGARVLDARVAQRGTFRVKLAAPRDLLTLGILSGGSEAQLRTVIAAAARSERELASALTPFLSRTARARVTPTSSYVKRIKQALDRIAMRRPVTLTVAKIGKLQVGDGARASIRNADLVVIDDLELGRDSHVELTGASTILRVNRSLRMPMLTATGSACPCLATIHAAGEDGTSGAAGAASPAGTPGPNGLKANCGWFDDTCATPGGHGGTGVTGQEGGPGGEGGPGTHVFLDFRALATPPSGLCVSASGGRGGAGGNGGPGGRGGAGGTGGMGAGCEYGAKGGNGGKGGTGGTGGPGADGGDAGDVTLFVRSTPLCFQVHNPPGRPGPGGQPGQGGQGGSAGNEGTTTGDFSADRSCSRAPTKGRVGTPGSVGAAAPAGAPGAPGATVILTE